MNDFKLDSRPNIKSGFKTPDGYFDSLADRVMLSLPIEEVKVIPLYRRRPIWVTSAAAALVLSLSLVLSKNDAAPAMPDNAAIEDYLVNQAGLTSYDLQKNLNQKDLSDLNRSIDISDKAIEEYFSDENIDYYE